jgi:hypothetical protein
MIGRAYLDTVSFPAGTKIVPEVDLRAILGFKASKIVCNFAGVECAERSGIPLSGPE